MTQTPIYLDYAAATPVSQSVFKAMKPYFLEVAGNPSSAHSAGLAAKKALKQARQSVARNLGVHEQTIIFTAGATESIRIAVDGIMSQYTDGHIVTTAIEHEAVLSAVSNYDHSLAQVPASGVVQVDDLRSLITDTTVLVSVMYANNEIGTIQPLSDLAHMIKAVRHERTQAGNPRPLLLHSDASQAASFLHVNAPRLGVDLFTLNGGKMYGPKQSGILYIHKDVVLQAAVSAGGQERGLRGGTQNVAAAVGFARALDEAQLQRKEQQKRLASLRDRLQRHVLAEITDARINGDLKRRLPNSLNITIPGIDGERAVMELDEAGVQLATGSACSASSDEPSHVLKAIGLTDAEASASLRISLGIPTTENEIDQAAEIITTVLAEMR